MLAFNPPCIEDNRSGKVVNRDNREGRGLGGGLAVEQQLLLGSLGTKRKQVTSCCRKLPSTSDFFLIFVQWAFLKCK